MAGALSPDMGDKKRISAEGYSITEDEQAYLRQLCDGPKRPAEIATELADAGVTATELAPDPSEGPRRAETVADRLAYLVAYEGTEHLVERHGDVFALTDAGHVIFCRRGVHAIRVRGNTNMQISSKKL
jgi:hypothetical protein